MKNKEEKAGARYNDCEVSENEQEFNLKCKKAKLVPRVQTEPKEN